MANSLAPPTPVAAGRAVHKLSGSTIDVTQRAGKMVHRLTERGLTAEYGIRYQIGGGTFAHTYLVEINGYLFESPATWFRSAGWDVSPGYAGAPAIDFDRPITETCLFCHAGNARFSGTDGRTPVNHDLASITCERCHGPSEEHARHPQAGNIVNPAKLPARARDSVCEQCHLEGEVRVLNPGKTWRDFHPGDNLESMLTVYVPRESGHEPRAVSQVEQLAESRCLQRSQGKLWCGTCHNPHGRQTDRKTQIRDTCRSCHAALSAAHVRNPRECTTCHMPRLPTDYAHVAVTDHRILRRHAAAIPPGEAAGLAAWVEPPPGLRARNQALAELIAGVRLKRSELLQAGLSHFRNLPVNASVEDSELQAAVCDALVQQGKIREALPFCRDAATGQPKSANRAMALGAALARAQDFSEAERHLNRAIGLDPSLKHAYVELWTLLDRQHKTAQMAETIDQYLAWNPANIMFRLLKAEALNPERRE